jgi:hypothetical protein
VDRSVRRVGPRHRADGPPDAGPGGAEFNGSPNEDVVPARGWTARRRGDRRQAESAAVPGPEGDRRKPGSGRRRAEDRLDAPGGPVDATGLPPAESPAAPEAPAPAAEGDTLAEQRPAT